VGAFLVSAKCADGRVQWVRVTAEAGGPLRLVNPWEGPVEITRDGAKIVLRGRTLVVDTKPGEVLVFQARGI